MRTRIDRECGQGMRVLVFAVTFAASVLAVLPACGGGDDCSPPGQEHCDPSSDGKLNVLAVCSKDGKLTKTDCTATGQVCAENMPTTANAEAHASCVAPPTR
jgi:hypothetical protein